MGEVGRNGAAGNKKEFFARVDQARKDIAEGKRFEVDEKEALASLLESIYMFIWSI